MSTESHILVIDDDADIARAARMLLERHGMRVSTAADPAAAWVAMAGVGAGAGSAFDVILLDLNFARGRTNGAEGFALLDRLIAADPDAVVIVVTGHSGIAVAVQAMRGGAADFVIKPWNNERLLATVERGVALRAAKREGARRLPVADDLLLGESDAIARARDRIARIAATDAAVLIHGPAGSGKSLVARLIQRGSTIGEAPFAILDASIAAEDWPTRIAAAQGGTLLIDHVDRWPRMLRADLAARHGGNPRPVACP